MWRCVTVHGSMVELILLNVFDVIGSWYTVCHILFRQLGQDTFVESYPAISLPDYVRNMQPHHQYHRFSACSAVCKTCSLSSYVPCRLCHASRNWHYLIKRMLDQSEIQILRQLVYTQSAQLQAIATIADIQWDGVDRSRSLFIVISYYALSSGTVHN